MISGFTYVRNGLTYGYPFSASIKSLLPLVDELIVVVGDSDDGTREAVSAIRDSKIKIIDTVWDHELRENGKIFALQSNIGLAATRGEWAFHIQADEVIHEKDYELIRESIRIAGERPEIDGILFPFYHFWGDYHHIRDTRKVHPFEIRIFKKKKLIKSYKDSQGFRIYPSESAYDQGVAGTKLDVIRTKARIYHYSYSRHPYLMKKKDNYFHRFWHDDDWLKQLPEDDLFDFNEVDQLEIFNGTHPAVMQEIIAQKNWDFIYDPGKSNMRVKDRFVHWLNKLTGKRWFEYQNYRLKG